VKICLPTSDMFVYGLTDNDITYEVRDGLGKLLEPRNTSKISIKDDKMYFDSRFIPVQMAAYCVSILG